MLELQLLLSLYWSVHLDPKKQRWLANGSAHASMHTHPHETLDLGTRSSLSLLPSLSYEERSLRRNLLHCWVIYFSPIPLENKSQVYKWIPCHPHSATSSLYGHTYEAVEEVYFESPKHIWGTGHGKQIQSEHHQWGNKIRHCKKYKLRGKLKRFLHLFHEGLWKSTSMVFLH